MDISIKNENHSPKSERAINHVVLYLTDTVVLGSGTGKPITDAQFEYLNALMNKAFDNAASQDPQVHSMAFRVSQWIVKEGYNFWFNRQHSKLNEEDEILAELYVQMFGKLPERPNIDYMDVVLEQARSNRGPVVGLPRPAISKRHYTRKSKADRPEPIKKKKMTIMQPRSSNQFILYRSACKELLRNIFPKMSNAVTSKLYGNVWKCEHAWIRDRYAEFARQIRETHSLCQTLTPPGSPERKANTRSSVARVPIRPMPKRRPIRPLGQQHDIATAAIAGDIVYLPMSPISQHTSPTLAADLAGLLPLISDTTQLPTIHPAVLTSQFSIDPFVLPITNIQYLLSNDTIEQAVSQSYDTDSSMSE
jgi:hypothetical protein